MTPTFAFPPAVLMDYTYENFYNTVSDAPEPYFWRSSMMNQWQIDPTHSVSWTPEQRANVKKATDIYKSSDSTDPAGCPGASHFSPGQMGTTGTECSIGAPALSAALLYIFRPNSNEAIQHVALKGLADRRSTQSARKIIQLRTRLTLAGI